MNKEAVNIELGKKESYDGDLEYKLSPEQRRKIRKSRGLSYSDLLKEKFRQQNLARLNAE